MTMPLTPEQERLLNEIHNARYQRSQARVENEAKPEPKRPRIVRAWEYGRSRVMP